MNSIFSAVVGLVVAGGLAVGCSSSSGGAGGSPAGDGGGADQTAACGGAGEACCDGTACNAGLTCNAGTCSGSSSSSGSGSSSSSSGSGSGSGSSGGSSSSSSGASSEGGGEAGNEAGGDAGAPVPTSCQTSGAGTTNCGAAAESCCTSPEVPGATYDRAYTRTDAGLSGTGSPATVGTFRLDKYSVTVGRFRTFVTAWDNGAGWYPPAGSGKHTHLNGGQGLVDSANDAGMTYEPGWIASDDGNVTPTAGMLLSCGGFSTWTASAGAQENLPIGCVNWYEAYAFCIWDGGFLPSEAEWEYAAAGGSQQLEYPWGSADPGTANQYGVYGCYYNGTGGMTCSGVSNIGAVGLATMGAGLWGQLDLTTNMSQWVLDWTAPFVTPCTDCASLTGGTSRVTRGGNYLSGEYEVVSSNRSTAEPPADRTSFYGFRCARTP